VKLAGLAGLVGPRAAKSGKYNVLEYRKSLALQSHRGRTGYLFLAEFQSECRPFGGTCLIRRQRVVGGGRGGAARKKRLK